jgi:hypothetical protein
MEFKYVIMSGEDEQGFRHEVAFLFPGIIFHKDFSRFRRFENFRREEIVAAGFAHIDNEGKVWCDGYSESLGGMRSRGDIDAQIIMKSHKHAHSSLVAT